jgi:hypothetical protein
MAPFSGFQAQKPIGSPSPFGDDLVVQTGAPFQVMQKPKAC